MRTANQISLHFTGPPVPITARMRSTPQKLLGAHGEEVEGWSGGDARDVHVQVDLPERHPAVELRPLHVDPHDAVQRAGHHRHVLRRAHLEGGPID
eukprot:1193490-Prorocentrum_minimum.AAC.1